MFPNWFEGTAGNGAVRITLTGKHEVRDIKISPDVVDPEDPRAQHCRRSYFGELDERFRAGFDPRATRGTDPSEWRAPGSDCRSTR